MRGELDDQCEWDDASHCTMYSTTHFRTTISMTYPPSYPTLEILRISILRSVISLASIDFISMRSALSLPALLVTSAIIAFQQLTTPTEKTQGIVLRRISLWLCMGIVQQWTIVMKVWRLEGFHWFEREQRENSVGVSVSVDMTYSPASCFSLMTFFSPSSSDTFSPTRLVVVSSALAVTTPATWMCVREMCVCGVCVGCVWMCVTW